ncbi:extracellular solute-binding protein [Paenibacillus lutimineralis]|uniref:Extracellular solute-binding protein n=1 Tax=Paenibacillus lutimineralis TaxID=2707005 RepID=A0A3S9V5I6_9BACL|nr:extracellular solute-binding protein [Paenibacillus lutimineralis]AZS17834.1 extracellular solute-binding protein [Paenibacillus lutimineralis]
MNMNWRKVVSFTVVMSLLATIIVGCGSKADKSEGGSGGKDTKERLKISMMYPLNGDAPKKGEAWKWMEDKFNVELDLMAIPANGYAEKLRLTVASGDLPDMMVWTTYPDPELIKYVKQNAFLPFDDLVGNYKNLMETPQQAFDNVKIDKKLYSIPRTRPLQTNAVLIRKDWLDNLGLPVPVTTEDFANVALKFTTEDPDKNGKADTFGIGVGENLSFLEQLWLAFDAGNGWRKMEDGTLMNSDVTPGRKEALGWLTDLYKQGAIDKDFPVLKYTQVNEKFIAGKSGILIGGGIANYGQFVVDMKKLNPNAEIIMIDPPTGPSGTKGTPQSAGFYGHWVINAKTSPEKVDKIMEILDWQATDEALEFKRKGIEGVHHKLENGVPVVNEQYNADGVINLIAHNKYNPYFTTPGATEEVAQAQLDQWKNIEQLGVPNPAVAALTLTMQEKMADLEKYSTETFIKIVTGGQPLDSYDQYVEEWMNKGGKKMTEEVNEWYSQQ